MTGLMREVRPVSSPLARSDAVKLLFWSGAAVLLF